MSCLSTCRALIAITYSFLLPAEHDALAAGREHLDTLPPVVASQGFTSCVDGRCVGPKPEKRSAAPQCTPFAGRAFIGKLTGNCFAGCGTVTIKDETHRKIAFFTGDGCTVPADKPDKAQDTLKQPAAPSRAVYTVRPEQCSLMTSITFKAFEPTKCIAGCAVWSELIGGTYRANYTGKPCDPPYHVPAGWSAIK